MSIRKTLVTMTCCLLLNIAGPSWPRIAEAAVEGIPEQPLDGNPAVMNLVQDYRAVRKVALALAVLGFLLAVVRLGISEFPAERHRAESLAALTAVVVVLLAGDKMIARGVSEWFSISPNSLPPFWR